MATEDFSTYTEDDDAEDYLSRTDSRCTATAMLQDATCCFYKDMGAGHFGDFTHLCKIHCPTSADNGFCGVWSISENSTKYRRAEATDSDSSLYVYISGIGADDIKLFIYDVAGAVVDSVDIDVDTDYWLTIDRTGNVFKCWVYTDFDRQNLLAGTPLEVECTEDTLQYIRVTVSDGHVNHNYAITAWIEDLDLQEEGAELTHSASDTLSMSDSLSPAMQFNVPLSDTLSIGDSLATPVMQFNVPLSDQLNMSDALTSAIMQFNVPLSDTLSIGDSLATPVMQFNVSLSDQLNMSDALTSVVMQFNVPLSDILAISDSLAAVLIEGEIVVVPRKKGGRIHGLKPARVIKAGRIGI